MHCNHTNGISFTETAPLTPKVLSVTREGANTYKSYHGTLEGYHKNIYYIAFSLYCRAYYCKMDHDSEVSLSQLPYILPRLQETCNPINFKPVIEAILFITISYTLITISTLSYRFRYYFKYYLLVLRLKKQKLNNILDNRQFAFDAFISCERKDAVWVKTNLLPMLENEKTRLKFCVAQRDFLVGSSIIDNIMNSINKSRKTIVVLSDHFFKSGWCMEELLISHHVSIKCSVFFIKQSEF